MRACAREDQFATVGPFAHHRYLARRPFWPDGRALRRATIAAGKPVRSFQTRSGGVEYQALIQPRSISAESRAESGSLAPCTLLDRVMANRSPLILTNILVSRRSIRLQPARNADPRQQPKPAWALLWPGGPQRAGGPRLDPGPTCRSRLIEQEPSQPHRARQDFSDYPSNRTNRRCAGEDATRSCARRGGTGVTAIQSPSPAALVERAIGEQEVQNVCSRVGKRWRGDRSRPDLS